MNQPNTNPSNDKNNPAVHAKTADMKTSDATQKANPNFTPTGFTKTENMADNKAKTPEAGSAVKTPSQPTK